jgi:hypothetical protein
MKLIMLILKLIPAKKTKFYYIAYMFKGGWGSVEMECPKIKTHADIVSIKQWIEHQDENVSGVTILTIYPLKRGSWE